MTDADAVERHQWTTCRAGGDPTEAGSAELVTFCTQCGAELSDDNRLDTCPPDDFEKPALAPKEWP